MSDVDGVMLASVVHRTFVCKIICTNPDWHS